MAIVLMLGWWYSQGWLWTLRATQKRLQTVGRVFAVSILIRTLFAPWKQIQTVSTFQTFFRDLVDNTVSRGIGAVVRGAILFWTLVLSILIIIFGIISFIVWPIIPLFVIILPILTISGVTL